MEKLSIVALICIIFLAACLGVYVFHIQNNQSNMVWNVTIEPSPNVAGTPLLVAQEKGFFTNHNLNVTFIASPSGTEAMKDLLNNNLDFILVNEYTLSDPNFYNKTMRVVATLTDSDTIFAISRTDKGIHTIPDLEGKIIGVSKGSIGEYFMDRFFSLNGLSIHKVTIRYLPPAGFVDAFSNGSIDALFTFEPYIYQIRQKMGDNITIWPANLGQHAHFCLITNESTITDHPEMVKQVLDAVLEADSYIDTHPDEAKKIAQKITGFDQEYMDKDWQNHHFTIALPQSLITAMEDETRWRMRNNLTNITEIPDFYRYANADILHTLLPSAVTIID